MADPIPTQGPELSPLEQMRRRRGMRAPGSAAFGGPAPEQALQEQRQMTQGVMSPAQAAGMGPPLSPEQVAAQRASGGSILQMGLETAAAVPFAGIGGAIAGGAFRGATGYFRSKVGRQMLPRVIGRMENYATIAGRMAGSAGGMVAGGELYTSFADETPEQTAERRQQEILVGAGAEGLTALGHPVMRYLAKGIRGKLYPFEQSTVNIGAREVADALASVKVKTELGMQPGKASIGQLVSGWPRFLQSLSRVTMFGGEFTRGAELFGVHSADAYWDKVLSDFAGTVTKKELGEVLGPLLSGSAVLQRTITRSAYQNLDLELASLGQPLPVDLWPAFDKNAKMLEFIRQVSPTDPVAQRIIAFLESGLPMRPAVPPSASPILGPSGQAARTIPGQPAVRLPTNYETAAEIRSYLLDLGSGPVSLAGDIKTLARRAAADVETQIQSSFLQLQGAGGRLALARDAARKASAFGHKTFDDDLIAQLTSASAPEDITKILFENDAPTRIERLYSILDNASYAAIIRDPQRVKTMVKSAYMTHIGTMAGKGPAEFGGIHGTSALRAIKDGGETFTRIFETPEAQRSVIRAARALEMMQDPSGSAIGTMYLGMRQSSATVDLFSSVPAMGIKLLQGAGSVGVLAFGEKSPGAVLAGSSVILFVPALMGRIIQEPMVTNAMLRYAENRTSRMGLRAAQVPGYVVSRALVEKGIPHVFRDPNGKMWDFTEPSDPYQKLGPLGPLLKKGSAKPQSKF